MKKRTKLFYFELVLIVLAVVATLWLSISAAIQINSEIGTYTLQGTDTFIRTTTAEEEGFEDETICPVEYQTEDGTYTCTVEYTYEEWKALTAEDNAVTGYIYVSDDGRYVAFNTEADNDMITAAVKDLNADAHSMKLYLAMAIGLIAIGLCVVTFGHNFFTTYEKIWFLSILVLAAIFSIVFPEEDRNGINAIWIMALYLADTLLNIACELLISKQSKWNFIVSVFVELTEIAICVVLAYRFATMATTLLFWLPIDIISFINWNKHPDKQEEELTEVRKLSGWQEVLVITGIVLWTVGVGYFLTSLDFGTDLFNGNRTLEVVVCYLDACVSAVGIANGVFILLRYREQWIAWYIDAILEAVINILSGQYVLLVLKVGYLTNTTYGYIRWTKYIQKKKELECKKDAVLLEQDR